MEDDSHFCDNIYRPVIECAEEMFVMMVEAATDAFE